VSTLKSQSQSMERVYRSKREKKNLNLS